MTIKIELGKRTKVEATMDITAENLQSMVLDRDLSVKSYEVSQGISKANLAIHYANPEIEIENFIGGVEITQTEAESAVPSTFPNSSKVVYENYTDTRTEWDIEQEKDIEVEFTATRPELDDDGNVVMAQVNWIEYTGLIGPEGKYLKLSKTSGKLLMEVGRRNKNGRKDIVHNDEFRRFVSHWTINRVLTKSEFETLVKPIVNSGAD